VSDTEIESVEDFRQRARGWLADNMPKAGPDFSEGMGGDLSDEEELAVVQHNRDLQRMLFDAGLAGVVFPKEYGGQGLTHQHMRAFNEEIVGYEYPSRIQVPTFTPCAAVLLEFGSDEMKQKHIPAILKGEEIWMQFLSEPSGGSDVAGALTTAVRDGDEWILNGSKIWTTGAWWSDWGLCLARTNWDVPKHRGLSVFILPIHQPGIDVQRIEMLNGSKEFCQEYIDDVRIPDSDRVSDVDDGWTVGIRWMFYERSLSISPYPIRPAGSGRGGQPSNLLPLAKKSGRDKDTRGRELVGEAYALASAQAKLAVRIPDAMAAGRMNDQAASIGRLMAGMTSVRQTSIAHELAGSAGVAWAADDASLGARGEGFLMRQTGCIGGGTTEMARNVISERVLGMPRERAADRDIPFRDVERSAPTKK
jgi:alkylation response protein AidB-like acyl-CoA dehydrogenase